MTHDSACNRMEEEDQRTPHAACAYSERQDMVWDALGFGQLVVKYGSHRGACNADAATHTPPTLGSHHAENRQRIAKHHTRAILHPPLHKHLHTTPPPCPHAFMHAKRDFVPTIPTGSALPLWRPMDCNMAYKGRFTLTPE